VHGNFSIAVAPNAKVQRSHAVPWSTAVRQFFHPWVLALLTLAMAIGCSGYGYKLSQYMRHSEVTKPSATRMWVEHREDSHEALAHQQQQPHKLLSPQFFAVAVLAFPQISRELVFAAPIQSRILTFVSPLHPLRAPPISLSSLA
jgi:hypothetical protein